MTQSELVNSLAEVFHANDFRGDGKTPYIQHLIDVTDLLKSVDHGDDIIAAAWGHDLLEIHSNITPHELLRMGVCSTVVDLIVVLTRLPNEEYHEYVIRISNNYEASIIKIADMICNLSDKPTFTQRKKYKQNLWFLISKQE